MAVYRATSTNSVDLLSGVTPTTPSVPIGGQITWWGSLDKLDRRYLPCDGRSLNKADYPKLYDVLGDTYGSTETTFNIPKVDGRVVVHYDSTNTQFNQLGKISGELTHTLTIDELTSHQHFLSNSGSGTGSITINAASGGDNYNMSYSYGTTEAGPYVKADTTGNSQPFNIVQPSIVAYKVIKVLEDSYTTDLINLDQKVAELEDNMASTGGHKILDANDTEYPQKDALKFIGAEIKDTTSATEIITPSIESTNNTATPIIPIAGDMLPIGTILPYGGSVDSIEDGYYPCLGELKDIIDDAELFTAIGYSFNNEQIPPEGKFYLPDMRDKTIVGKSDTDPNLDEVGKVYGEKTHTLIVDELASHYHQVRANIENTGGNSVLINKSAAYYSSAQMLNTESVGGGQPHNNMQPSMVANYIIKAKNKHVLKAGVINSLTSESITDAVAAAQAKNLKDQLDGLQERIDTTKSGVIATKTLTATSTSLEISGLDIINNGGQCSFEAFVYCSASADLHIRFNGLATGYHHTYHKAAGTASANADLTITSHYVQNVGSIYSWLQTGTGTLFPNVVQGKVWLTKSTRSGYTLSYDIYLFISISGKQTQLRASGVMSQEFTNLDKITFTLASGNFLANTKLTVYNSTPTVGPTGPQGPRGYGVPTGGKSGQVLVKKSDKTNDTEWVDANLAGGSGSSVVLVRWE